MDKATFKALLRTHGRHARVKGLRQMHPVAIVSDYRGAIVKGPLAYAHALVKRYVIPALPHLEGKSANRITQDADETKPPPATVGHALDSARAAFARKYPREKLATIVTPVATDLARFQAEQLNRQLREAVTVDVVGSEPWLPPVIDAFTQENVSLIKSIPADYFSDLEKKLSADLADGVRWEELTETIAERYGIAERRAELIARDQAGKFFGDLNRVRQVDLGIDGAIWRGMLDNRERDEHLDREGQSFDWETGIDGETPGQPVLCRCNGEPDLQRLFDED